MVVPNCLTGNPRCLDPEGLDLLLQLHLGLSLHVHLGLGQMRNLEERNGESLSKGALLKRCHRYNHNLALI